MEKLFIVIEKMDPNYPVIVTDKEGTPLVYDDEIRAYKKACECQNGQVVELTY